MPVNAAHIHLTNFADARRIEEIFASSLVDVAYVVEVHPDRVFVTPEPEVDLNDPKARQWLKSVIESTLRDNGLAAVNVEFVGAPTSPTPLMPPLPSLTISLPIACPYPRALAFLSRPETFPQWASGLSASPLTPTADPHTFCAQTPAGPARIRFTPPNPFGVLDHYVLPENAPAEIHIPMRLLPNNDACEITLYLRRQPTMTDAQFAADAEWVRRDLATLKTLLESSS